MRTFVSPQLDFFFKFQGHKNKSEFVSTPKLKLSAPSTRKRYRIFIELPQNPEGQAVISNIIKLKLLVSCNNSEIFFNRTKTPFSICQASSVQDWELSKTTLYYGDQKLRQNFDFLGYLLYIFGVENKFQSCNFKNHKNIFLNLNQAV